MSSIYVICFYERAICCLDNRPCQHTFINDYGDRLTDGLSCKSYVDDYGNTGGSSCDDVCSRYTWQAHSIAKQVKKFEYHEDAETIIGNLTLLDTDIINYLAVDYGTGLEVLIDQREREGENMKELTFGQAADVVKQLRDSLGREPEQLEIVAAAYELGYKAATESEGQQ